MAPMRTVLALAVLAGCWRPAAPPPPPVANAAAASEPANPVRVAYKVRGYFFASSKADEGLGGHSIANNAPRPNGPSERGTGLYAQVILDEGKTLDSGHDAIRVLIVNNSGAPAQFEASDARLYVVQEARLVDGTWAPIEYLPASWCGNSYHTLTLPTKTHWEFLAPRYGGSWATKLRVKVSLENTSREPAGLVPAVFYSNEFAGSIDPAQFTVEQGHAATGIMDPYVN